MEAATRIVQRDGVTALTFESAATESGLTKGGLLYHFPTREDLLLALHEHVAGQWEACMEREAGAPLAELTDAQRLEAYIRASQNPDRAELLLMLESAQDPEAQAAWDRVPELWAPPAPGDEDHETERAGGSDGAGGDAGATRSGMGVDPELLPFLARLAADGLWFYEALTPGTFSEGQRSRLVEAIVQLGTASAGSDPAQDTGSTGGS
nr:TetR family transcriptional regulator [Nesterenkonia sp. F]